MADIRINALATTAASTASDDFIAVDGSANGTRKLNAYSPTFGGAIAATGTSTLTAGYWKTKPTADDGTLTGFALSNSGATTIGVFDVNTLTGDIRVGGTNSSYPLALYSKSVAVMTFGASSAATLAGNLTVSGTGTSSVAGKLEVGGTQGAAIFNVTSDGATGTRAVYVQGGNTFPSANSLIRADAGGNTVFQILGSGNTTLAGNLTVSGGTVTSGTGTLTLNSSANTVVLQSAGTTALTLDTSQNATFAGTVTIPKCIAAGSAGLSSTRFGIYFGGTLSGSTDQIAIVSAPTFDSSAVSLAAAGYFAPATANSSFTAGAVYGLYVASTQKGAASTITTNYGLRIFDQASGATNYAIYTGSGLVRVGDTTASTSTSTGALTVSGGIGVAGAANFGGAIAIGNTVNTVSPTSPNRTITMVIGGTTYYLAAKTTND
jgi:fibronectin-binding autotransporter adhesin